MSNTPIHALGSDGVESNPVERGAWVLPHLLHTHPRRPQRTFRNFRAWTQS